VQVRGCRPTPYPLGTAWSCLGIGSAVLTDLGNPLGCLVINGTVAINAVHRSLRVSQRELAQSIGRVVANAEGSRIVDLRPFGTERVGVGDIEVDMSCGRFGVVIRQLREMEMDPASFDESVPFPSQIRLHREAQCAVSSVGDVQFPHRDHGGCIGEDDF
jgi:hypothetical protein